MSNLFDDENEFYEVVTLAYEVGGGGSDDRRSFNFHISQPSLDKLTQEFMTFLNAIYEFGPEFTKHKVIEAIEEWNA